MTNLYPESGDRVQVKFWLTETGYACLLDLSRSTKLSQSKLIRSGLILLCRQEYGITFPDDMPPPGRFHQYPENEETS